MWIIVVSPRTVYEQFTFIEKIVHFFFSCARETVTRKVIWKEKEKKKKIVTNRQVTQWLRTADCQCRCNIITLDYLFNGFPTISTNYLNYSPLFPYNGEVKRTRAVTHHFIHLPHFFYFLCLTFFSLPFFSFEEPFWMENRNEMKFNIDSIWNRSDFFVVDEAINQTFRRYFFGLKMWFSIWFYCNDCGKNVKYIDRLTIETFKINGNRKLLTVFIDPYACHLIHSLSVKMGLMHLWCWCCIAFDKINAFAHMRWNAVIIFLCLLFSLKMHQVNKIAISQELKRAGTAQTAWP